MILIICLSNKLIKNAINKSFWLIKIKKCFSNFYIFISQNTSNFGNTSIQYFQLYLDDPLLHFADILRKMLMTSALLLRFTACRLIAGSRKSQVNTILKEKFSLDYSCHYTSPTISPVITPVFLNIFVSKIFQD